MSRLLPAEQEVLWLRIEGHSHEEIAARMNISSVSARQMFHRAKHRLYLMAREEA
jgi:DNA-directed RNA polymerase specialized sigma24 family protein